MQHSLTKFDLIEKIKNQPPNTSHHQLAGITGVLKSTIAVLYSSKRNCEMNGHYSTDNKELPKKRKREGTDLDVEEALN
jgi:hypothetical protein